MSDPTPQIPPENARLKALFASPRFFWITVLYSAGSVLALFSGSLNLFGALISIGLWLLLASAREPGELMGPRGLRVLRGVLLVLMVVLWAGVGLMLLYALLLFSIRAEGAPSAEESAQLFGGLLTAEQAAFFWQYGGLILLGLEVLMALLNLFYFRRGRELVTALMARLEGINVPLRLRGVCVWMLLLGIVNLAAVAVTVAMSLRRSMLLPVVSDILTGAGRILGAFFLLRELPPVPEEPGEK